MMVDLQGLEIVVTRPQAQSDAWASQLAQLGAMTYAVPLLEIVPVQEPGQIRAIQNHILDFDLYNKAIFVSQNAVEHGVEWIENYWPQLPVGIDFFAVGDTTARQLDERGIRVTDLAQAQHGAMNSETLLESPALQQVAGDKILIFRGKGGRPHLGEVLKQRGAQVEYCELYERRLPTAAVQQLKQVFQQAGQPVVTLHSGEALQNFCTILQMLDGLQMPASDKISQREQSFAKQIASATVLLVPGTRVLEQALAAGFTRVHAAQNATEPSMLQGLMDLKHNLKKV